MKSARALGLIHALMRSSLALGALLFFLTATIDARAAPHAVAIDYRVRKLSTDRYEVTLRFRGNRSGRSTLHLPGEWADAQHAERGIEGLEVLTAGATVEDTGDAAVRRIVHSPNAVLQVRYRLRQIEDRDATTRRATNFLPVIQPSYFEWIGWTTWVVPTEDAQQVNVHVSFDDLPDDWNFASSFGLDRHAVSYRGSIAGFRAAIFVGGDFRLRSRVVRGGQLVTAVRGDWPFRDSELADRIAAIVDGERTFWRDTSQPAFLVTLMPPDGGASMARYLEGTSLGRSFATFIAGVPRIDNLEFLFTHEYFHTWNPHALGRFGADPPLLYWFSEGFTEYYSQLLRLRWKLLTLTQYAGEFDRVLKSLATLREKNLPNTEIGARFFTDELTVGKLPYWRGMLLAARWDAEIRASSHGRRSLDDAMRALHDQNRSGTTILDTTRIARAMRDQGVSDPPGDIRRLIDEGQTIELADDTLTACVRIDRVAEAGFEPGFDITATTKNRRMTAVVPEGAAYAAGLREGDIVRSVDMDPRANRVATIGVQVGDEDWVREVSFLPAGKPIERQRAVVRADADPTLRASCLAELGVPH